ncbi:hypothetical protein SNA40_22425, partial [Escherichia coli]|nr:hypothetical protein [Escherichia coli]
WLQPCLLKIYSHMVTFWGNYEGISQSLASFACLSFGLPVILVGGAILLTGIVCTVVLNEIDAQYHLSEKLKDAIRDGLKRQQELDKWKRENMTPFMYVLNTPPVI